VEILHGFDISVPTWQSTAFVVLFSKGSILWSLFSAILADFKRRKLTTYVHIFKKTQVIIISA
jgi:hypothetical protein